jgi:multidrug efflux pump
MAERQQALAAAVLQDPAVESLSSFIGVDGVNTTANAGRIQINLKPLAERDADATEIIRRLQPRLAEVQGATLYMQPVQDLTVDDRVSRTQFQYSQASPDSAALQRFTPLLIDRLRALPEIRDLASDQQTGGLELALDIDRDTAARLGITPQMIDDTLYDAFGQRQVSTIFTQLNQYRVVLEVDPSFQQGPEALDHLYVRSSSGAAVPLASFTSLERRTTALAVTHQGQFPAVTLSFNTAPGVALGPAVEAIHRVEREIGLPSSVHGEPRAGAKSATTASTTSRLVPDITPA